jgi:hypothetical protein
LDNYSGAAYLGSRGTLQWIKRENTSNVPPGVFGWLRPRTIRICRYSWLLWLAPWLELRPKPGSLLYPIEASCDLARGSYFFARRFLRVFLVRLPADLSTKKSSRLAPTLIAAVNHLG